MNDKLQDAVNDSLEYLAEYAEEYLELDSIERIKQTAQAYDSDPELYLGQAVYEVIKDMDSSPEQEYGFIAGIRYCTQFN